MSYGELLKDGRVRMLAAVLLLAIALVAVKGMHFGIEFEGGTRIPITLERPAADAAEMSSIIDTIKTRASKYGLTQVVVRGVGSSEVYVEVPQSDQKLVEEIEKVLREVGKFEGIVDGRVAISGNEILRNSITTHAADRQWAVSFTVTSGGAKKFGQVVFGKGDYPLYMFLDRPENGVVIAGRDELFGESTVMEEESLEAMQKALVKEDSEIPIMLLDDWNATKAQLAGMNITNGTKAIVGAAITPEMRGELEAMGFKVVVKEPAELKPSFTSSEEGGTIVTSWPAVGLLSSPILNPSITQGGTPGLQYQITGASRGATAQERQKNAEAETKLLKSILSGGELPTNIILGSVTTIPAPLGKEFLRYSVIGAVGALLAIALLIVIRYREPRLIVPIIAVSATEIIILVCIIGGLGTVDLSAMAGIIAAVGVSVDAQIVMSDELLKKGKLALSGEGEVGAKLKLDRAFYIVMMNAIVATVAMVPLLFSGLVEISGFATAQILGAILGVSISRPAYGAFVERIFIEKTHHQHHEKPAK